MPHKTPWQTTRARKLMMIRPGVRRCCTLTTHPLRRANAKQGSQPGNRPQQTQTPPKSWTHSLPALTSCQCAMQARCATRGQEHGRASSPSALRHIQQVSCSSCSCSDPGCGRAAAAMCRQVLVQAIDWVSTKPPQISNAEARQQLW